jgi:endoglucanase
MMIKPISVFILIIQIQFALGQNLLPRIRVSGKDFVTENSQVITFKGINASDPDRLEKAGHWNDQYFAQLKSWGANLVRFPVHPSAWRERGKDGYLKLLDEGIRLANAHGLYVIIDWHSIGNLKSEIFYKPYYDTSKKETFDFWRTMAEKYGKVNTVAFFELYNEPTLDNNRLGLCSWEEWSSLMTEIITLIRAHGAKNIPLVAGFDWAYDLKSVETSPFNLQEIAYVSHPYPQKRNKPWEPQWEQDFGFAADKYPVLLTELGFCFEGDKGAHIPVINDGSYPSAILSYCNKKGMSYCLWVFDPTWSPMLIEDWTYKPTKAGAIWKEELKKYK